MNDIIKALTDRATLLIEPKQNAQKKLIEDYQRAKLFLDTFEKKREDINSLCVDQDNQLIKEFDSVLDQYRRELICKIKTALDILINARKEYSDSLGESSEVFRCLLIANNGANGYQVKSLEDYDIKQLDRAILELDKAIR